MTSGPLLLGLTGSIGMGKSTTAQMFKEAGIPVWDADAAVSQLYAADGLGTKALAKLAPQAITENGVDKVQLKALIQRDPSFLKKLEAIVHPLVFNNRNDFIKAHSNTEMVLLDIPLLFENGSDGEMDHIIVVTVSAEVQKRRVMDRGTMDEATFNLILSKQTPDEEKRAKADFVVETTSLESARTQVQNIIEQIRGQ